MPTLKAGPQASTRAPRMPRGGVSRGPRNTRQTIRRIALVPKTPIRSVNSTVPDYPRWPAVRLSAGGSQEFQFGQPHAWNFRSLSSWLLRVRVYLYDALRRSTRIGARGVGHSRQELLERYQAVALPRAKLI